jgi:hypothetical protein
MEREGSYVVLQIVIVQNIMYIYIYIYIYMCVCVCVYIVKSCVRAIQ